MQLVLDFGNTFQKCAIYDGNKMVSFMKFEDICLKDILEFVRNSTSINSCILSSVMDTPSDIVDYLNSEYAYIELSVSTPIPIINNYGTPDTLGKDRLAVAVAISKLANGNPSLSVDIGTAIKFDIVTAKKEYLGGSISPGLFLRFKALHTFTAKLPLVDYNIEHHLIGRDTQTSILSGVMNGAIAEVNAFIQMYRNQYMDLKVFITGGESIYFVNHIKSEIFADSNLVLIGLNEILLFNE